MLRGFQCSSCGVLFQACVGLVHGYINCDYVGVVIVMLGFGLVVATNWRLLHLQGASHSGLCPRSGKLQW